MIVPQFWAESRRQHRSAKRQFTVRRFGWSDESIEAAQLMADQRADAALREAIAGRPVLKKEPKVPYNGASGTPIREEVISRHGDCVITRNSYGARCLNTPDALFADIDWTYQAPFRLVIRVFLVLVLVSFIMIWVWQSNVFAILLSVAAASFAIPLANLFIKFRVALSGGMEQLVRARIYRFLCQSPEWNIRFYRTPAGFRLLATHALFQPEEKSVGQFFQAMSADPIYTRMCLNQRCFRARLSAKPWRIGINIPLKPRPGVWPVRPERLPERTQWVSDYEAKAASFAACRFIESLGSGGIHPKLVGVIALHDQECRAMIPDLPMG